nr:hypothetical protein [uncultured Campylobacter sp.]
MFQIFIILLGLFAILLLISIANKRKWSKILGYEPTLDEMSIILELRAAGCSQEKVIEILHAFNSKMLDKKAIDAIIKDKKQKLKLQTKRQELQNRPTEITAYEQEPEELTDVIGADPGDEQTIYSVDICANRCADIVYQSLHIAINSKKLDTIESRIGVAENDFKKIIKYDSYFAKAIENKYKDLLRRAYTAKYINVAQAYYEKYQTLKSQKAKGKYFDMAKEHLEKGMEDFAADQDAIRGKYRELFDENFKAPPQVLEAEVIDSDEYPVGTTDEMIELFKIGNFDELRMLISQLAYKFASTPQSDAVKKIGMFFVKRDPMYIDILSKVQKIVSKSQGIKQSTIYNDVSPDGVYSVEDMRYVLYYAAEYGDIIRKPFGNSYKLYTKEHPQDNLLISGS